jgi:hypothetical protein
MCKCKNSPFPDVEINLPPGALEEAAKEAGIPLSSDMIDQIYDEALLFYQQYIRSEKG